MYNWAGHFGVIARAEQEQQYSDVQLTGLQVNRTLLSRDVRFTVLLFRVKAAVAAFRNPSTDSTRKEAWNGESVRTARQVDANQGDAARRDRARMLESYGRRRWAIQRFDHRNEVRGDGIPVPHDYQRRSANIVHLHR